jgi:hypothetical protein
MMVSPTAMTRRGSFPSRELPAPLSLSPPPTNRRLTPQSYHAFCGWKMISYTRQEKVVVMVKTPRWSNILPFEKKPSKWMPNQGLFKLCRGLPYGCHSKAIRRHASGKRRKPCCKGERLVDFPKCTVVIFFVFIAYEAIFTILLRHLEGEVLENLSKN